VDFSECPKVSEFKISDFWREEILGKRGRVDFNDRLNDIYTRGNFSDFHQLAKFANIFSLLT
jgi:hypothetical protein